MHADEAHAVVGATEVEDREVGDHVAQLVVLLHPLTELGGAVVPDAGDDVDLLHEHLR
jgi:hypothetical protein